MISLAGYAAALAMGFRFALFAVPVFQTYWGGFCIMRLIQESRCGGHKADAPKWERESFGFALGGLVSSGALLLLLVVLTQIE